MDFGYVDSEIKCFEFGGGFTSRGDHFEGGIKTLCQIFNEAGNYHLILTCIIPNQFNILKKIAKQIKRIHPNFKIIILAYQQLADYLESIYKDDGIITEMPLDDFSSDEEIPLDEYTPKPKIVIAIYDVNLGDDAPKLLKNELEEKGLGKLLKDNSVIIINSRKYAKLFFKDKLFSNQIIQRHVSHQPQVHYVHNAEELDKIKLEHADGYIIKPPTGLKAFGIFYLPLKEVKLTLDAIFKKDYKYFSNNRYPIEQQGIIDLYLLRTELQGFLLQEAVIASPVSKDGKDYSPTYRAFAIIIQSETHEQPLVKIGKLECFLPSIARENSKTINHTTTDCKY